MVNDFLLDSWTVRPDLNLLERAGESKKIPPRMMDVLVYLNARRGEVVTIDELLSNVWNGVVVGEGSVYLSISGLREQLGRQSNGLDYIETIRKRGYRLNLVDAPASVSVTTRRRVWPGMAAATLVVSLLVGVVLLAIRPDPPRSDGSAGYRVINEQAPLLPANPPVSAVLALLDDAIAADPGFGPFYAAKAFYLSHQLVRNIEYDSELAADGAAQIEERSHMYATLALDLDPDLPLAHAALGNLDFYSWRWQDALEHFERAGGMGPPDQIVVPEPMYALVLLDRPDEAIALAQERFDRTHGRPESFFFRSLARAYAGMLDDAAADMRDFLRDQWPADAEETAVGLRLNLGLLVQVEIGRGNAAAVTAELAYLNDPYLSRLAGLDVEQMAREQLAALASRAASGDTVGAGDWAVAYLASGQEAEALQWLATAAELAGRDEPDPSFYKLVMLKTNIARDPVLGQPEFAEVLDRISGE